MKRAENAGSQIFLAIIAALFLAGAIGGNITAYFGTDGGELTEYFGIFHENAAAGLPQSSFWGSLVTGILLPMLIFLSGFSALGVAIVPICVLFKGFSLGYAVSAIVRAFGARGIWLAAGALGLTNLIYVPCLLLTALFAFRSSTVMASVFFSKQPKAPAIISRPVYFIQFGICSLVILGLASFQAFLQPGLLSWMAALV